ncbi:MAG: hypothetical protein ACFB8W_08015 [Elainellaceae cyanobacterium]
MATLTAQPLLRLLRYGKPYRLQVGGAIANSILNTLFDLAPPYLIGIAIDIVVNEENSLIARLSIPGITGQLAILSLLTLLIWSLESLTEYFYSRLWRNLAQTLQHELRVDTYSTTVLLVGSTFIVLAPGVSWWAMAPIPFVIWGEQAGGAGRNHHKGTDE